MTRCHRPTATWFFVLITLSVVVGRRFAGSPGPAQPDIQIHLPAVRNLHNFPTLSIKDWLSMIPDSGRTL